MIFPIHSSVLLRCDFNVPIVDCEILDTKRIDELLDFIMSLIEKKNKVVLVSHLGRPKNGFEEKYSLRIVYNYLSQKLKEIKIHFVDNIMEKYHQAILNAKYGEVIMVENVRFCEGEESNEYNFKSFLVQNIDYYCNEAFSCSHRAHASIMVAEFFSKDRRFLGPLAQKEIKALEFLLQNQKFGTIAIIGGSKISTKINLLKKLQEKVEIIIIVGAMANNLIKYKGFNVGKSLVEDGYDKLCEEILSSSQCRIIFPEYVVVTNNIKNPTKIESKHISNVFDNDIIVDVDTRTILEFEYIIKTAQILLWNGPLGVFEIKPFDKGTNILANKIADLTQTGFLKSIVGGGDTLAAIKDLANLDKFTHVSTAGGAFLECIESDCNLVGLRFYDIKKL